VVDGAVSDTHLDSHVSAAEQQEYYEWVMAEIAKYDRVKERTEPLWHYTSGQGAIDIIGSGTIWATQVGCLNDTTELIHAPTVLRRMVETLTREASTEVERAFFTKWLLIMHQPLALATSSPFFVACFSEHGDDLSQWRAYGGGEGGIALGFHPQGLFAMEPENRILLPVQYDETQQLQAARRVCEATFEFHSRHGNRRDESVRGAWEREFSTAWDVQLSYLSPVFKNAAFAAEREWRIIKQVSVSDFSQLKFKQRQSMISRHIPVCFGARTLQPPRLPLIGVRVGPSKHKAETEESARLMLMANSYDINQVEVSSSPIPFQAH
jgi:hypothetical protein